MWTKVKIVLLYKHTNVNLYEQINYYPFTYDSWLT